MAYVNTDADLDPAAPMGDGGVEASMDLLIQAANEGTGEEAAPDAGVEAAPLGSVVVDAAKAEAFLKACMTSNPRVGYGLGKKIKSGQVPGKDFVAVDCSGFVREAMRRSTNLGNGFPDGSVVQHDWIRKNGFTAVPRGDAALADGVVRIAFLRPQDTKSGIGHVVLLNGGHTLESHGGVGPDSRRWDQAGWQAKAFVYRLSP